MCRPRCLPAICAAMALVIHAHSAHGQTTTTTAAALPDGPFQATIARVVGMVQVRESSEARWQTAKAGMKLGEGAEFRTGPRSAVMCELPNQIVTLDRLGTFKLMQAIKEGN